MTLKRLIVSFCIVFIFSITFIEGYTRSSGIVYADSNTDEWTQVTTNAELVEAFRYYCKSRDVTINGGVADAVTSFTTKTFNGICNTLGIDVTALQAQLKYQTDGNLGTRFLFTATGVDAYNRIFAQFLQDNDLSAGDEDVNKLVESGEWFTDLDGNGCYVYVFSQNEVNGDRYNNGSVPNKAILKYGTPYKYNTSQLVALAGGYATFNITENDKNLSYIVGHYVSYPKNYYYAVTSDSNHYIYGNNDPTYVTYSDGHFAICRNNSSTPTYYLKLYRQDNNRGVPTKCGLTDVRTLNRDNVTTTQSNIYITSTVINNNTYEGDTIINNNGTTGDDNDPDPDPDNPNYNPYPDGGGGTTPPTNTGGGSGEDDGTITFPDFDFHLPEINWSLGDLSQKFPFSIPFDLIAFFTVLNAEPEAPAIDADIPLGSWYTWHFEADFSQFDSYAVIIRNVEFIGFCVGLIYLTVKLVKG